MFVQKAFSASSCRTMYATIFVLCCYTRFVFYTAQAARELAEKKSAAAKREEERRAQAAAEAKR